MSDMRPSDQPETASWIESFAAAARTATFTPWTSPLGAPANDFKADAPEAPIPVVDPDAIRADSFAHGFEEGRRTAELEIADQRTALARLAESLEALRPEPTDALAVLLAETVERLVRQIVGEVEIDPVLLANRAQAAAALVGEEVEPGKLLVHPDDIALLEGARIAVPIVGDPALTRGTVMVECASGWIEDGPVVRLDRLRTALDRLGAPA